MQDRINQINCTAPTRVDDAYSRVLDALTAAGCRGRGKNWQCPACQRRDKLRVWRDRDSIGVACYTCPQADVLDALRLTWRDIKAGGPGAPAHIPGQVSMDDEPEPAETGFTAQSAIALDSRAIPVGLAEALGILPVRILSDLPEELRWAWDGPGMVIEWRDDDRTVPQYRPDTPERIHEGEKEPRKYVFPADTGTVLNWLQRPEDGAPVLFAEGALKGPSVAAWVPEGYGVVAMMGCRAWGGDLTWAEDREVIVLFDADTASNRDVYDEAVKLRGALGDEGASSVKFIHLNAARSKDGIDDVLGRRNADKRAAYLQRLISNATDKLGPRPAARKPAGGRDATARDAASAVASQAAATGRKPVMVNRDLLEVMNDLTVGLMTRDGESLFNHGGALSEYDTGEHTMEQVTEGRFRDVLQQSCRTVRQEKDGTFTDVWPDANTMKAVFSRGKQFSRVRRIVQAPFMRADGTICTTPGYDRASMTYAGFSDDLQVSVPDSPTPEQVKAAVSLLLDDWWCDMPFPAESDRANAMAMLLTPFIRDLANVVPLAIVDGLQMGSGKNLLADCCSIVFCGTATAPQSLPDSEEETRKQITSTLRQAPSTVVFDEAHVIGGKSLAHVLTAETWADRILGVSDRIALPNMATWVALGNNVQVNGDMQRRYYPIRLHPAGENPQNRPTSSFRHPDLKEWTGGHRGDLLTAVLTLVRAWHVAGRPYTPEPFSFGSFERWQRIVGGILQVAGVGGLLGGLQESRTDADVVGGYWIEHLTWLQGAFGENGFTCADVRKRGCLVGADHYVEPPGLSVDCTDRLYSRELGNAYRRVVGQTRNGMRLVKLGKAHGNSSKYAVEGENTANQFDIGGSGGSGGTSSTYPVAKTFFPATPVHGDAHMRPAYVEAETTPPGPPTPPTPPADEYFDWSTA